MQRALMTGRMGTMVRAGPSPMLYVTVKLIGSQIQAALNARVFGQLIPSYVRSHVADNIIIQKESALWVLNCPSADCRMHPLSPSASPCFQPTAPSSRHA